MNSDPVPRTATQPCCLHDLVRRQAEQNAAASAILAPGRAPLSYGRLSRQVEDVVEALRSFGIGCNDRVALVLPEGPELAAAFIAIAAGASCAPLNPAYRASEFEFHLADLGVRALLVASGSESPAVAVARARGIALIELSPLAEAGCFTLAGERRPAPQAPCFAQPDDVALLLHTSGTAARPKLVPLTHRNLCASAHNIRATLELTANDRCLNVMPLFHIHGLSTVFASLAAGASLVCTTAFSGSGFLGWLQAFRPTWYTAAPTIHQVILEHAARHPDIAAHSSLRFIRSASSAMPRQLLADMERVFRVPFLEAYGMTEAAPQIASNRLPPGERRPGSVGRAAGPDVAIMDEAGNLLPPGETGEVVVQGANVMRAYENNAEANRGAFLRGWFRTGDRGHLDANGCLYITGRLKEIINRGGEKVSPREVEEVLLGHPAVAQAVTFAVPHPTLGEDVAAALVQRPGTSVSETEIRRFASTRLAPFKVPQQVVIVAKIPKGSTGKVQRIGLAEKLGLTGPAATSGSMAELAPPRTALEKSLAEILAGVLGRECIGIHDNFFQCGGHSLLAAQVMTLLWHDFQAELSVQTLFDHPTVAELAEFLNATLGGRLSSRNEGEKGERIPRRKAGTACPLSLAQHRLWLLDQIEPGNPAYNMAAALRLTGPLRLPTLEQCLNEILRRHEALRTTIRTVEGQPVQVIAPVRPLRLPVIDLTSLAASERQAEAMRLGAQEAGQPFHLAHGPLVRATLLRLDAEEHLLLLTMHHIVSDGWSTRVLHRELSALYDAFVHGRASPLPELPIQYADFAHWQREWARTTGRLDEQLAWWKQQLGEKPPVLDLPKDRPRTSLRGLRGARQEMLVPQQVTERLREVSRREGATLFMTLLAAYQTLLSRYTGQDDLVVGTPIANRPRIETEGLIGFFANTLALRADLSGDPPFLEFLGRVRATALGAYAHSDLPFERLVEELKPDRDPGRPPLVQVMFVFQNLPAAGAAQDRFTLAESLTASPVRLDNGTAKFDLTLYLSETEQGLTGSWQYNADLFEPAAIQRLAGHFQTLLAGIAADAGQRLSCLPLLTDAEREQVLVRWNATASEHSPACLHELFEAWVERVPDAPAVCYEGEVLTYRELNRRANLLAHRLRKLQVEPDVPVGLCSERSLEMVVGLLGILKAGGAYLPLDPAFPRERLAFMLADARATVIVTQAQLRDRLPDAGIRLLFLDASRDTQEEGGAENPMSGVGVENLAYVIYTSGSTGRPKGVAVEHRQLSNYLGGIQERLSLPEGSGFGLISGITTDLGHTVLFPSLCSGGFLHVISAERAVDGAALAEYLERHPLDCLKITPSHLRALQAIPRPERLLPRRCLVLGGETLARDWAHRLQALAKQCAILNHYGPTETTVGVLTCLVDGAGLERPSVPLGRPLANTRVYVLDAQRQLVPVGVAGELYIGGRGLARGYLNRPELTAEHFLPDPFSDDPAARLYRTGDRVRYLPDGNIEFLGRLDQQVKVRGYRIEPGEVEAVLGQHPGVRECVVAAQQAEAGDARLIAYVVPQSPETRAAPDIREFLKCRLPDYMVPATIVELAALPRTPNGKVDRQALPGPNGSLPKWEAVPVAPASSAEQVLAGLWTKFLGVERVGLDDNFFELGGDSLMGIQLIAQANQAGLRLRVKQLFEQPTIAGLARAAAAGAEPACQPPATQAEPCIRVTHESARAFGREALERAGLPPEGAALVTEVQLEASLRGQPTHNLGSIPRYARRIAAGTVNPRPRIQVERETATSGLLDGDNGPGQWIAVRAMELAIRKAKDTGVGVVGAKRSNHLGAAGHYAWLAAQQGFIGLSTSNAGLWLAPTGGLTPTFGNNPLGVGIPAQRRHAIILDIALSVAAKGRIGVQLADGQPLPPGWILDRHGRSSTDPADLAAGLGVPIGGHKGYGLTLVMEVLAGVLTGAGFCWDHRRNPLRPNQQPHDLGHFFLAINPELFMPLAEFGARVDRLIEQTKGGERAENVAEILVPGELEMRARARNLREGVPLSVATYRALLQYQEAARLSSKLMVIS